MASLFYWVPLTGTKWDLLARTRKKLESDRKSELKLDTSTWKRVELDPNLTPYTKMNSNWAGGPHTGAATIRSLENSLGVNDRDLGLGNSFLAMTSSAPATAGVTDELDITEMSDSVL